MSVEVLMKKWRWGILATGGIAHSMAQALAGVPRAEVVAAASRSKERADAFGEQYGIAHCYGSYAELAADEDVDVVYIASPHSEHAKDMRLCLEAGKHVLCEKAFTLNAREAAECIELARHKGLFLMEAMWMRYFPAMAQVRRWLEQGVLGDIRLVQADFCFNLPFDAAHRLYDPALGGGALLDLGIYPLSFAVMLLGLPDKMEGLAQLGATGVDEVEAMILEYERGTTAVLSCSMRVHKPREAFIVGSKGYIKIHDVFFRPDRLTLAVEGQEPLEMEVPFTGNGYAHEVEEVHACLDAGALESALMPLDETLALMRLMDEFRARWGVVYAIDKVY